MSVDEVCHDDLTELANAVSDAMSAAMKNGMGADEACSVVITVAADYGRGIYGNSYLGGLVNVVLARASYPLPKDISEDKLQ